MTKRVILVLFLALPVLAQDQAGAARAAAGCGPWENQFDVKTDEKQHPMVQPESGKAVVYVFQDEKRDDNVTYLGHQTTRVGLDGSWIGANHGKSYFFLPVDPGDHHLCSDLQTSVRKLSRLGYAVSFTAESGKIYYFRALIDERTKEPSSDLKLERVDVAEGEFLIASSALSNSQPKK